jgi:hypothetical protein
MKTIILITIMILIGCKGQDQVSGQAAPQVVYDASPECDPLTAEMPELDGRDAVLIIGDSISMNYTDEIHSLMPDFQIMRNSCNGKNTTWGARYIELWVDHADSWAVCTINHGLWNLFNGLNEEGELYNQGTEQYLDDLEYEISVLKTRCEKVIFVTTTSTPILYTAHTTQKVVELNDAAKERMAELEIPVCDIYPVTIGIDHLRQQPESKFDVHWSPAGARLIAEKIKTCIEEEL